MLGRTTFVAALAASLFSSCAEGAPPSESAPAGDRELMAALEMTRAAHALPILGAAVISLDDASVRTVFRSAGALGPSGGARFEVAANDRAMTATLVARLAEAGRVGWDESLPALFPDVEVHQALRRVTLLDLLQEHPRWDGAVAAAPPVQGAAGRLSARARREELSTRLLTRAPEVLPEGAYGNLPLGTAGYSLVAAALETRTDTSFEALLSAELFGPLGMKSCRFSSRSADGDAATAEAEHIVRCRLEDWALFARDQLLGARGEPALLDPASYARLQRPDPEDHYAIGWAVGSSGELLHHGSSSMSNSFTALHPDTGKAFLVATSQGGLETGLSLFELYQNVRGL